MAVTGRARSARKISFKLTHKVEPTGFIYVEATSLAESTFLTTCKNFQVDVAAGNRYLRWAHKVIFHDGLSKKNRLPGLCFIFVFDSERN